MRDEMEMLQSLNLKEVWIKAWRNDTGDAQYGGVHNENQIPNSAFYLNSKNSGKRSLNRIVLPVGWKQLVQGLSMAVKISLAHL